MYMEPLNRNTYEAYFLLYVDNELSPTERREVEDFVQLHPDLQPEFQSLLDATLSPDEQMQFPAKEILHRQETFIHTGNYTTVSLLYIDNELTETERGLVEKFYAAHPALLKEWETLQQTVLPEEKIIFKDKKSLYKKTTPVYVIGWKQLAAIAAVLLLVVAAWWFYPHTKEAPILAKTTSQPTPVKQDPASTQPANRAALPAAKNSEPQEKIQQEITYASNHPAGISTRPAIKKENTVNQLKKNLPDLQAEKNLIAEAPMPKIPIDQSAPDREKLLNNKETVRDNKDYMLTTTAYQVPAKNIAQVASYKELDMAPEEDHSTAIGIIAVNKEKLNGFFKQVGGLFGKKNKKAKEQNDVQIANLKINFN